jgi:hypothetical protein
VVLLGHEGGAVVHAVVHASWEVLAAEALEDGLAADGLGDDDAAVADLDDAAAADLDDLDDAAAADLDDLDDLDDAAVADLDDLGDAAVVYCRSYHLELADVVAATVAVEIAATEAVEVVVE